MTGQIFERISEIMEILSMIRFMLQDVQGMRKVHVHIHTYKIYYLALHVY